MPGTTVTYVSQAPPDADRQKQRNRIVLPGSSIEYAIIAKALWPPDWIGV